MPTFNDIKLLVVPPAKRTNTAINTWLASLPDIPPHLWIGAYLGQSIIEAPLKAAIQNPRQTLIMASAAASGSVYLSAALLFLHPVALGMAVAAGATLIVTYLILAAVICVVLAGFVVYSERMKLAKAFTLLLEKV